MLDRLTRLFSTGEDVELELDEAPAFHADHHERAIQDARERAEDLRRDAIEAVDAVHDSLDDLAAIDHDIQAVTDVTTNVARERKRAIESFDPPEDIAAFHADLAEMVEEWGQVTQKEQLVLDRAGDAVGDVFSRIDTVRNHVDRIDSFLQDSYRVLERQDRLESLRDRCEELVARREELTDTVAGIDLRGLREQASSIEDELDELSRDPRHDEMQEIRDDIAELESERNDLQKRVTSAAAEMDRGLKKLLYAARNGDVSLPGDHLEPLDAVRNGDLLADDSPTPDAVTAALDAAEEHVADIDLSARQVQKFVSAADTLHDLAAIRDDIQGLEKQIREKEDDLDAYDLADERAELEREKQRIESRIQETAEERSRLRKEKRAVEDDIRELVDEMEAVLDDAVRHDVTVGPAADS